jgi:uncharacterized membrane protein YciS (DUF1049 family)
VSALTAAGGCALFGYLQHVAQHWLCIGALVIGVLFISGQQKKKQLARQLQRTHASPQQLKKRLLALHKGCHSIHQYYPEPHVALTMSNSQGADG